MGLFDFPRINFNGNIDINVPTINNSVYFPLALYDQTRSQAFLPPRLYFTDVQKIKNVTPAIPNINILQDDVNGYSYIEIEPINNIDLLRTWCMNPLGKDTKASDAAYFPYYAAVDADKELSPAFPIVGSCPGYWNMYGDMSVQMSEVNVTGVQILNQSVVQTWKKESKNIPADVLPYLNASFDLDSAPGNGATTACMVETISSQSVYASIFCNSTNLYNRSNANKVFFTAGPYRFAALIYSAWRVINWMPPMAGSGRFCSAIPLAQIPQADQMPLVQFFNANKTYDPRPLKGVLVTFTILEVFENRNNQNYYIQNKDKPNPAQATTAGSITPWYEGDMQTGVIGRNLVSFDSNPDKPTIKPIYLNNGKISIFMTPPIASLKDLGNGTALFSIDMGNSWPEVMTPKNSSTAPTVQPAFRGDASFESADLGTLLLTFGPDISTQFARININPTDNSRNSVFEKGCIFDFVIKDAALIQNIKDNFIYGFLQMPTSGAIQILRESEYMISSDQKGLYAEEGDVPGGGYVVNSMNREPCRLRIFQKGVPVTSPITVYMAEYIVPEAGNDPPPPKGPNQITRLSLKDNDIVSLSAVNLSLSNNAVYYFVYEGQYLNNAVPTFVPANYTVMDTGSFVCLRVHPKKDYSKYINPAHPAYTPPTFAVVYEEIFKLYDVVYPAMGIIHPFNAETWENGTMTGLLLQRTNPAWWQDARYMPRSRELSASQFQLLTAWANYIQNK